MARPRAGRSVLRESLEVRLALTLIAQSGRDDPTHDLASGLGPIGVDDGEKESLRHSDGEDSTLPVVPARVVALQRGAIENERGEGEIEPELAQVLDALPAISAEAHSGTIQSYIQLRNVSPSDGAAYYQVGFTSRTDELA